MIASFKHKGLKRLFENDDRSKLPAELIERIEEILQMLDAAAGPDGMNRPAFRLHSLKGNRKGQWAVTVRANWRIVFSFADGNRYEGEFQRGKPSGRGHMQYQATGDEYDGEFTSGIPQGRGTYRWKNGDRYDGQWQDGKMHGHGRHTWANGDAWDGEYANGKRTARGQAIPAAKP